MPDITVFGVPATNRDAQVPAPDSALPDGTGTDIQQWEDDGGAPPPEEKTPWHIERVERKKPPR